MGKTPAELAFIDDPMVIELKEPSWWWHNPKKETPAEQLAYAASLERDGRTEKAMDAYDDLVHEWHATPEALQAQLALARLASADGQTKRAYDENIYLLAHFAGRFPLEPVLRDAVAQADFMANENAGRTFRIYSGQALRQNYERIIHFAPRWPRVPELLLRIAELYEKEGEYAGAITVCDRIIVDWPSTSLADRITELYCRCCRLQADVWKNDIGRLHRLERLIGGALRFRPAHPNAERFAEMQREIYIMRRERSYAQASFYDNPAAYSPDAALRAYQAFLRDFPDAPQAAAVRTRVAELNLQLHTLPAIPAKEP